MTQTESELLAALKALTERAVFEGRGHSGAMRAAIDQARTAIANAARLPASSDALVAACTGHEDPQLWRVSWLQTLTGMLRRGEWVQSLRLDPAAAWDCLAECEELYRLLRQALASEREAAEERLRQEARSAPPADCNADLPF